MLYRRIICAAACAGMALGFAACSPEAKERILTGDAKIATAADVEELAQYTEITGRLTVKRADVSEITLPHLRSIGGKLYVQKNAKLTALRLPALQAIGSDDGDVAVIERNQALVEVSLGGLKTAAYQIAVRNNDALERIDLGSLVEIIGLGLEIADNRSLLDLEVDGLLVAASVSVTGCPSLSRVAMPDLTSTTGVVLERNDRLEHVDFSGLERVFAVPGSQVAACRLSIVGNPALKGLHGLKSLAAVAPECEISVRDNPALPSCDASGLFKRLAQAGWRGVPSTCGNKIDTCGGERCGGGASAADAGQ
jgi:hypothetical protein